MKEVLRCIIVVLILIAGAVGVLFGIFAEKKQADTLYNNGICLKCGTEFHLINVEHVHNGGNHYFYACENEHIIECTCEPSKTE